MSTINYNRVSNTNPKVKKIRAQEAFIKELLSLGFTEKEAIKHAYKNVAINPAVETIFDAPFINTLDRL